jgi:hypothetical protein
MPDAVYHFVKDQQETWNALTTKEEQHWKEWRTVRPKKILESGE